eukprot:TRINITY_DN130_c0_g1_i2.p2 TRINITY_DN130_c0_g1~~TRINITY_DN130_c0_g1_i2.p2  ORF type:complete len:119 (+),score=0.74 TRINITY_DN130_c0_g1_i2:70-426(+)
MCVKSHNFTKFKLMELQLQEDNIIFIYLFIYLLIYLLAETLKLGGIIGRIKRIVLRPYRRHFRSRYLSPKFIFLTVSMLFFGRGGETCRSSACAIWRMQIRKVIISPEAKSMISPPAK